MKKITQILVFFFLVELTGCDACVSSFYGVHEEVEYLNIEYDKPAITAESLLNYLDSTVKKDTNRHEIIFSFRGESLHKQQRIIHFKNSPDEYYRVYADSNPCWIMSIYNVTLDKSDWIYSRKKISGSQLKRIEKRFEEEILDKIRK